MSDQRCLAGTDKERQREKERTSERENCSLGLFIDLNGCKIAVVWLNRTFYYHQMICSTQSVHLSLLQL